LALHGKAPVEAEQGLLQAAHGEIEFLKIILSQTILDITDGHLDRPLLAIRSVRPKFERSIPQATFGLSHKGLGTVAALHLTATTPVIIRALFRLSQECLKFVFIEIGTSLNRNGLLASGGAIGGTDLQKTVGIDVEGHLHLRDPARGRWDPRESESTQ
jgi:hypothetical protein